MYPPVFAGVPLPLEALVDVAGAALGVVVGAGAGAGVVVGLAAGESEETGRGLHRLAVVARFFFAITSCLRAAML